MRANAFLTALHQGYMSSPVTFVCRAAKYGDTADECGEAFFLCGKSLLELARWVIFKCSLNHSHLNASVFNICCILDPVN